MKILIADDDAYTREGLVESVDWETLGIDEIMQAVNGQDALTTARWFHPDIILTDIRMPQMDGLAFARELLAGSRESREGLRFWVSMSRPFFRQTVYR